MQTYVRIVEDDGRQSLPIMPASPISWSSVPVFPSTEPPAADYAMSVSIELREAPAKTAEARRGLHDVFRLLTREPLRVSATDTRQRFADLLSTISETGRPLIVTNHGEPQVVILSFQTFRRIAAGIARAVLALGTSPSSLTRQADDMLDAEISGIIRRIRQRFPR